MLRSSAQEFHVSCIEILGKYSRKYPRLDTTIKRSYIPSNSIYLKYLSYFSIKIPSTVKKTMVSNIFISFVLLQIRANIVIPRFKAALNLTSLFTLLENATPKNTSFSLEVRTRQVS